MPLPFYETRPTQMSIYYSDRLDFGAHLHNEIEMIYMLSGTSKVYVDGVARTLQKGDVFLCFPNQVHMYFDSKDELYLICILSPELLPDNAAVFGHFQPENPIIPISADRQEILYDLLQILLKETARQKNEQIKLHSLRAFFSLLLEELPLREAARNDGALIQDIYNYVRLNFREPLSISLLAEKFHISESYAAHIFSQKLKLGFSRYVNALRVNEACTLLQNTPLSVTEIAYACGFTTIRTFNRAFFKEKGVSPRIYRQQRKK